MRVTKETLKEMNSGYAGIIGDRDVEIANTLIDVIENTRSSETPKAGDYLRFTSKYGDYNAHAHIEYTDEERYGGNVCEGGSCAFITAKEDKSGIRCSGSGGPWCDVPVSEMKYVGEEEKMFWTWGSYGAGAHQGIYFTAKVNVWEYESPEQITPGYTTKDYDKFYMSDSGENSKYTKESGYRYYISTGAYGKAAFEDIEGYKAWLHTFRGVEFKGKGGFGSTIIWAWKETQHHISPKEFDAMDLPEDTFLFNGAVRRCKRKYVESEHCLHTYFVWYWDEEGDWRENAIRQNEIRDKYYTLPWGTPTYVLARKELGL